MVGKGVVILIIKVQQTKSPDILLHRLVVRDNHIDHGVPMPDWHK